MGSMGTIIPEKKSQKRTSIGCTRLRGEYLPHVSPLHQVRSDVFLLIPARSPSLRRPAHRAEVLGSFWHSWRTPPISNSLPLYLAIDTEFMNTSMGRWSTRLYEAVPGICHR